MQQYNILCLLAPYLYLATCLVCWPMRFIPSTYVGMGIGSVYFAAPTDAIGSPMFECGTQPLAAYDNWVSPPPPSSLALDCIVNSLSSLLSLYCIFDVDVFTLS